MRFSATHKLTTYLMVCAAVASLWLSPDVALFTKLFSAVAIAVSWLAEPGRFQLQRLTPVWNIATLGFFVYLVIGLFHDSPVITTGVHFLLFVLINKLFNRISSKDYRQIYVISFLVLVAATTLNTDITYALCFAFYVIFATWALTLFHLRRRSRRTTCCATPTGCRAKRSRWSASSTRGASWGGTFWPAPRWSRSACWSWRRWCSCSSPGLGSGCSSATGAAA